MNQWDELTGSGSNEYASKPTGRKQYSKPSSRGRSPRLEFPSTTRPATNTKPTEVSDRVWANAQDWKDRGRDVFDRPVPVNQGQFAKRLNEKIKADKDLQKSLRKHGPEYVNDLLSWMIEKFWSNIEVGQDNTSALQFAFLNDEWDDLMYRGETYLHVKQMKESIDAQDGKATTKPFINWDRMSSIREAKEQAAEDLKRAIEENRLDMEEADPEWMLSENVNRTAAKKRIRTLGDKLVRQRVERIAKRED